MELHGTELANKIGAVAETYRRQAASSRECLGHQRTSVAEELDRASAQLAERQRQLAELAGGGKDECDPVLAGELATIHAEYDQACEDARARAEKSVAEVRASALAAVDAADRQLDDLASVALHYDVENLVARPTGTVPQKHDIDALRELARKANEDSRIADTKRLLGIDGYYRQSEMAADVLRMREEMNLFLVAAQDKAWAALAALEKSVEKDAQAAAEEARASRDKAIEEAQARSAERVSAARRVREWQLEASVRESAELVQALRATDADERAVLDAHSRAELAQAEDAARTQLERLDLAAERASLDRAWEAFGACDEVFDRPWAPAEDAGHKAAVLRSPLSLDVPAELAGALEPLGSYADATNGQLQGLVLLDVAQPEPLLIRHGSKQRDVALAAARRLVLSCTRAVDPANLEIMACDPIGTGTSLGKLGGLFAGARNGRLTLATTESQVGNLIGKLVDGIGTIGATVAGSSPATVAQYNATHPGHELPHRVLVLFDIERGVYQQRTLENLAQLVSRAADFGITVIMTRQDTPPARGALREKPLGKIERRSSVATLAKSGPKGSCELRLAGEQRTLTGELLCDDGVSDAFVSSLAAALNG